jgi:hypothetical protein
MGLRKLKVQVHLWAFIFSPEQKIRQQQHIKDKTHRRKMQYGRIKCRSMSRSKPHLVMDSGGLISSEEQEEYLKHNYAKTIAGGKLLGDNIIF